MLLSQTAEQYSLKRIHSRNEGKTSYILRMIGIMHGCRYRPDEYKDQRNEKQSYAADKAKCCAIDHLLVLFLFVGKAEECGLHTKGKQHEQQCSPGIHLSYDTVSVRIDKHGMDRYQQIVEESAHYAANSVNGRILGQ